MKVSGNFSALHLEDKEASLGIRELIILKDFSVEWSLYGLG